MEMQTYRSTYKQTFIGSFSKYWWSIVHNDKSIVLVSYLADFSVNISLSYVNENLALSTLYTVNKKIA